MILLSGFFLEGVCFLTYPVNTLKVGCLIYYNKFKAILGVWLAVARSVAEACCKI